MGGSNKFSDSITPLWSGVLDAPPSCLEFVPRKHNPVFEYFIVGTYTLLAGESQPTETETQDHPPDQDSQTPKKPQEKVGGLKLFRIDNGVVKLVQESLHESAVFDLHFLPDSPNFAVVTNTGDISVFKVLQNEQGISGFEHTATHHLIDAQITYFSWYPYGQEHPPLLAATLDSGKLIMARFGDWDFSMVELLDDEEETLAVKHGHDESAWCCAWSAPTSTTPTPGLSGRTLLSGGDDAKLRLLHMSIAPIIPHSSVIVNTEFGLLDNGRRIFRPHESGVTYILPLPVTTSDTACILLTGGYDDYIRVYTTYNFHPDTYMKPKVLAELNLGGGVWRLRFLHNYEQIQRPVADSHPLKFRVLASCAWAGARILEIEGTLTGEWSIKVLGTVTIHQSMCYASDVQPLKDEDDASQEPRVCISSSFYDKLLCLWKWDPVRAGIEDATTD